MTNDGPQRRTDHKGAARRAQILRMLQDNPRADLSVEEIAQRFGVSYATVRRDLTRLREQHGVARTYGGIALLQPVEVPTRERRTTFRRAKEAIGRHAAGLVSDCQLVVLDAGSTTSCLAEELRDRDGLTVVTNGIGVINALMASDGVDLVVLGGRLRGINETITGGVAEDMLRQVHATTAFLGTDAIDADAGLACRTLEQSRLKSVMMQRAARVVVLADSSKLDGGTYPFWSPLDRPWELVTDAGASAEQLERMRQAGATHIHLAHDDGSVGAWGETDIPRQEIS
jgi:DeoR family transcriptional regulator, aga operon transcriptional repressor